MSEVLLKRISELPDSGTLTGAEIFVFVQGGVTVKGTLAEIAAYIGTGGSSTLAGLTDVNLTSLSNGQVIYFDTASSKWKNKTLAKSDVGLSNVDNTSDVNKPVSSAQAAADATTLASAKTYADTQDSTNLATAKSYADGLVVGLWDDRGNFDASAGSYPSSGGSGTSGAILKGDIWTISVAGTLPTGQVVVVGDTVRALVDTPGNTQANWAIAQNNIGYVPENQANKTSTITGNETSTTLYSTISGIVNWVKQGLTGVLSTKTTPVDADSIIISDSSDSSKTKLTTWANVKATLKTYFDAIYYYLTITTQTGTTYTFALADANTLVRFNSATAVTATVPLNASVTFPIGSWIEARQSGAGAVTISPASGVTINAPDGLLVTGKQYDQFRLIKQNTDSWMLVVGSPSYWTWIKTQAQTITGLWTMAGAVFTTSINEAQGADLASAATVNIGAATGNYINITGTTTITAFDSVQAGTRRIVRFAGALTLTYNATSLILPSSANITTVAGDVGTFVSLGSGNWKCVGYTRQDGTALVGSASLATTSAPGIVQLDTDANIQSNVNSGRAVISGNLAAWKTWLLGLANTWALKNTFTGGVQIPSSAGIYDANGNKIFEFSGVTSATDWLQVQNAISSGAVTLIPTGSTANMPFRASSKGASSFYIRTNSTDRIEVTSAGLVKLLAYTGSTERVATVATDGTINANYGLVDPRQLQQWKDSASAITGISKSSIIDVSSGYGSKTIASADINRLGARFDFEAEALFTTGGTPGNFTFTLDVGSSSANTGALGIVAYIPATSTTPVWVKVILVTDTMGSSGIVKAFVTVESNMFNNRTVVWDAEYGLSIDLTSSVTFDFSITLGTASVNSFVTKESLMLKTC